MLFRSFFARSDGRSVDALQRTLDVYCEGSGQKINLDKSSIFFGSRCTDAIKSEVMQKLGVLDEALHDTYLEMPTEVGPSPVHTFGFLHNRMWQRMSGVSDRPMSRKGKETFIKSVIQSIPTYIMSCFQLPTSNCTSIRSIANFL